jgi:hypothetical protein
MFLQSAEVNIVFVSQTFEVLGEVEIFLLHFLNGFLTTVLLNYSDKNENFNTVKTELVNRFHCNPQDVQLSEVQNL